MYDLCRHLSCPDPDCPFIVVVYTPLATVTS